MIAYIVKLRNLQKLNIIVNPVMTENKKFHENCKNVGIKYAEIAYNFLFNSRVFMNQDNLLARFAIKKLMKTNQKI